MCDRDVLFFRLREDFGESDGGGADGGTFCF